MGDTRVEVVPVRVHGDDRRINALLRMTNVAGQSLPLPVRLERLCRMAQEAMEADVVSAYVRERDGDRDELVMRGNVGLTPGVVGEVRLGLGEGITGFSAEHGRPVSVETAPRGDRFKPFPGIGEERFPSFLAVPLRVADRTVGVLVCQRREGHPFRDDEIAFAAGLAAPFALTIDRSVRPQARRRNQRHHRAVRLHGVGLAPGTCIGMAQVAPTFDDLVEPHPVPTPEDVTVALDGLVRELRRGRRKGAPDSADEELALMVQDQRLRTRIEEAVAQRGLLAGLRDVARSYALTPEQVGGEETAWMTRRARELEDVCVLLAASFASPVMTTTNGVLLLPEAPSRVLALAALARRVGALAVGAPIDPDDAALALFRAAGVPVVGEVAELFTWIEPGDRVIVDGDAGWIRVHPSVGEVVRARKKMQQRR